MDAVVRFSLYKWGKVPPVTKCGKCGMINTSDQNVVLVQISTVPDMWEIECRDCHKLEGMEW